jgi:hypothetical protein
VSVRHPIPKGPVPRGCSLCTWRAPFGCLRGLVAVQYAEGLSR